MRRSLGSRYGRRVRSWSVFPRRAGGQLYGLGFQTASFVCGRRPSEKLFCRFGRRSGQGGTVVQVCGTAGFGEAVVGLYQISRARVAQQAQVGGAEAGRLFTAAQAVFQTEAVDLPQFAVASLGNQAVAADDGSVGAAVFEAGVLGVQLRLRHADFAVGRGYFLPAVGNAGGDDGQPDGGKQCHDADNGNFRAFVAADVPAVGRGVADVEVVAQA